MFAAAVYILLMSVNIISWDIGCVIGCVIGYWLDYWLGYCT